MKILQAAAAGAVESKDCRVEIEPGNGRLEFTLQSSVIHQFGNRMRQVVFETLERLDVTDAKVTMTDKGALDSTIKARVEAAVYRAAGQQDNIPWGGAVR